MKLLVVCGLFSILQISAASDCKDLIQRCYNIASHCYVNPFVTKHCAVTCKACVPPTVTPTPNCGRRQIAWNKVIAGRNARRGMWPWQILLLKKDQPICGGTIISKRYVVTASHCVDWDHRASPYKVVIGDTNRKVTEGSEEIIQVVQNIMHSDYNKGSRLNNDIAILKLERDIVFTKYVQPICLPSGDIPVGHRKCYISGWGKVQHPGGMHPYLQYAFMPPVDSAACYEKNKKVVDIPVTETMICAGEGGKSRISGCHGDSGGPYVCKVGGRWELHGAASWGSRSCDSKEMYTVFARINYFKQWIMDMMRMYGES